MIDSALALGVALATVLFWLWRIPLAQRDVVYAEDGELFLLRGIEAGPWHVLLEPYAGYQHLVPRILSALAQGLPLERYGLATQVASVLVLAAIGGATVLLARDVVASRVARVALGLVPVVVPLAGLEVLANLANLHTYCLWLALWMLLWRPRAWWSASIVAVAMLAATLTEVQTLLLLPLAIARLAWMRERMLPIVAAFGIGVAGQVVTWIAAPRPIAQGSGIDVADVVVGWLVSAVRPLLVPDAQAALEGLRTVGLGPSLLVLVPFALAVVVVLVWGDARQRVASVATCLVSACVFGGSALATPFDALDYAWREGDEWATVLLAVRYGVGAGMLVAAQVPLAVGVVLDRLARRRSAATRASRALRVAVASVAVALVAAMALLSPLSGSMREGQPGWQAQVDEAEAACEAGATIAELRVVPGARVVAVPCDDLLERVAADADA